LPPPSISAAGLDAVVLVEGVSNGRTDEFALPKLCVAKRTGWGIDGMILGVFFILNKVGYDT
jgi:hypothetical protein